MPRIEHVPPAGETLEHYAREVCTVMAEQVDEQCRTHEVVTGLAAFLKLATQIQADHRNQQAAQKWQRPADKLCLRPKDKRQRITVVDSEE